MEPVGNCSGAARRLCLRVLRVSRHRQGHMKTSGRIRTMISSQCHHSAAFGWIGSAGGRPGRPAVPRTAGGCIMFIWCGIFLDAAGDGQGVKLTHIWPRYSASSSASAGELCISVVLQTSATEQHTHYQGERREGWTGALCHRGVRQSCPLFRLISISPRR
jgi:hypothetical protein